MEWIQEVLIIHSISAYQVTAIAMDNGANIVKDSKRKT